MPVKGERMLKCPDCKRKSVTFHVRRYVEDNWSCHWKRSCGFFAFTQGNSPLDRRALMRLQEVNPNDEI